MRDPASRFHKLPVAAAIAGLSLLHAVLPGDAEAQTAQESQTQAQPDAQAQADTPPQPEAQPQSQAPAPNEPVKLQEVVITAQKRTERVKDTPVAISVIGDQQLERSNATDITDINKLVPSVELKGTFNGRVPYSMRGVSTNANEAAIGLTSGVSIMVDGVPIPSDSMSANDLQDLQRVEVLKGPQSTLGGRTASAGVVNFITSSPTKHFTAEASTTFTDDHERRIDGLVSGPITDKLGFSLSAYDHHIQYPIHNIFNDENSHSDSFGARAKLKLAATPDLDITFGARLAQSESKGETFTYQYLTPGAALFPYFPFAPGGVSQAQAFPGLNIHYGNTDYNSPVPMGAKDTNTDFTLNVEQRMGGYTLTSTTALLKEQIHDVQDVPIVAVYFLNQLRSGFIPPPPVGPPLFNNSQVIDIKPDSFSEELKIASPTDQFVSYVAGVFFSDVRVTQDWRRNMFVNFNNTNTESVTRSLGLYGRATWNLTSQTSLLTGLRYNHDQISYVLDTLNPDLSLNPALSSGNSDSAGVVVGDVTLRQKLDKDSMVYGTYARGYKPRAFNTAATLTNNKPLAPVDKEDINHFELGTKATVMGGAMNVSAAAFNTTYNNYQVQLYPPGQVIANIELANAAKARTRGLELDTGLALPAETRLSVAAAYIDSKFVNFQNAPAYPGQTTAQGAIVSGHTPQGAPNFVQDLSGKSLPDAPKLKMTINLDHEISAGGLLPWDLGLFAQYAYRTSALLQANQNPQTHQPSFGILNLGITATSPSDRYSVTAFVNNVTDKFYLVNGEDFFAGLYSIPGTPPVAANAVIGQPARDAQRYFGVRLSVRFE